jgi:hypothetical protein
VGSFIFGFFLVVLGSGGRAADGDSSWDIICTRAWHVHRARGAADRGANGHGGGERAVRGIETCLDEVFAFWLGDEGLELGSGESIYEPRLRDDQQEDLRAGQGRKLVSLERKIK